MIAFQAPEWEAYADACLSHDLATAALIAHEAEKRCELETLAMEGRIARIEAGL